MPRAPLVIAITLALALGGTAIAQQTVSNPTVLKRIAAMSTMQDAVKRLGRIAKGKSAYDATAVKADLATIQAQAARIPALYKADIRDPNSEARPKIWSNLPDFNTRAQAVERASTAALQGTPATFVQDFNTIGAACSACHKAYRK